MAKRDLTKEKIILATIDLANNIGIANVSFPRLAEYFQIKAPSLYNHFKNMMDVKIATSLYLQKILLKELTEQLTGLTAEDALRTYAVVYRNFAIRYTAVYELLNIVPQTNNDELTDINHRILGFVREILHDFSLTSDEIMHASRMFRSMLHGYITMNQLGYFQNKSLPSDKSFYWMVDHFIDNLPKH